MKYSKLFILILYSNLSFGQNNIHRKQADSSYLKFSLTFSAFNHAEMIFDGETTYKMTNTSIEVINTSFGDKKGKVIFRQRFPDSLTFSLAVKNVGLDSVEDFYYNYCVMVTSGNEYFLRFKTAKIKKEIDLHHYYLKQVDDIVNIMNSKLPIKYKIHYLTKETKQDCKL